MKRLDFFIAGVQKGGTTALDRFLRGHPCVQMASRKETHFFDDDRRDWHRPDYTDLHALFDWSADAACRGEATPIHTYWPGCLHRIRDYNPDAKLIVCLRHPVTRAWSHWRMETRRGAETLPFGAAIRAGRQRVERAPGGVHRVYSYVERGLYSGQIETVLDLFGRTNTLFLKTEELWANPSGVLRRVTDFLGLPSVPLDAAPAYVAPVDGPDLPSMTGSDAACLLALFSADIERTAALTGLDLAAWTRADHREPIPSGADG